MFNPYSFFAQGSEVRVIDNHSMHCNKIGTVDQVLTNAVIVKLSGKQYAFDIKDLAFIDRKHQARYDTAKQEEENKAKEKLKQETVLKEQQAKKEAQVPKEQPQVPKEQSEVSKKSPPPNFSNF